MLRLFAWLLLGGLLGGCSAGSVTSSELTPQLPDRTVSFAKDVVPVLQQHCAVCHSFGGRGSRAVLMFDAAGQAQYPDIKANLSTMIQAIESGWMTSQTTPEQLGLLQAWQNQGSSPN